MEFIYLTKIKKILPSDNVVHPHGLCRENTPYLIMWILYYAWVIAFATWWTASPVFDSSFDTKIRNVMHIISLLSTAVFVFIIRKKWFFNAMRISAALIVLSMVLFYTLETKDLKLFAAITGSVATGCLNICIFIPFVFTLNNTEKLYAAVISNGLIQLISLINEHGISNLVEQIMSFILLLCSLSIVLFFKKGTNFNLNKQDPGTPVMPRRIYFSLLFNCAILILCKGAGKGILNIATADLGSSVLIVYCIGGLLGCLVYILIYAFTKKAFIWLGNITFSSVTIGLLCNAFSTQFPELAIPFSLLMGLGSTIGMIGYENGFHSRV